MATATSVRLFPWDPESDDHIARLGEQRIQCGWHQEKPAAAWRGEQTAGTKCIYWITLSPEDPKEQENLGLHLDLYPRDKEPLQDTSLTLRGQSRTPTQEQFIPVGHISLDATADVKRLALDLPSEGVYWIKTFYVSKILRSKGIGRAAMDEIESMAVEAPLFAKTLALDTSHKDDQMRPDIYMGYYGQMPKIANQTWYERRGYRLIKTVQNYYRDPDRNGNIHELRTVFLRKDLD